VKAEITGESLHIDGPGVEGGQVAAQPAE